jgi:cysteine sulfinate desulfinase/cysteine desulfurase-like protein
VGAGNIVGDLTLCCVTIIRKVDSPVLSAMGVTQEVGIGVVRFSLGRNTTRDEIDAVVERLNEALAAVG